MQHSDINYCSPWLACIFWPSPESALISTASRREALTFTHSGVNKVAGLAHHPFSSSYLRLCTLFPVLTLDVFVTGFYAAVPDHFSIASMTERTWLSAHQSYYFSMAVNTQKT
jgi:hypothetical protein